MKHAKPEPWMKKGVPVNFKPKFLPNDGFKEGDVFTGRLECDPFRISGRGRYVVRIGDMDERYQKITGRNVHSIAGIESISQVRR